MARVVRNGRNYVYRSIRRGKRVTSEYVASGEAAYLIGMLEANDREREAERKWDAYREANRIKAVDREIDNLIRNAREQAHRELLAAGYHRHHRGSWRKRRGD